MGFDVWSDQGSRGTCKRARSKCFIDSPAAFAPSAQRSRRRLCPIQSDCGRGNERRRPVRIWAARDPAQGPILRPENSKFDQDRRTDVPGQRNSSRSSLMSTDESTTVATTPVLDKLTKKALTADHPTW